MSDYTSDPKLTELLLKEAALETVRLDENLIVQDWSPGAATYSEVPLASGLAIGQAFPALLGLETELGQIRLGQLPSLELAKISKEDPAAPDQKLYYSLKVLPGESSGLLCIVRDVNLTTHLEQELTQERNELSILRYRLEEQNARLLELNQIKTAFLSIAAHELRSPLTSIGGFVELVLAGVAGPLNSEQETFLQKSSSGVKRMLALINDLLDLERMESGTISLELSKFNLIKLTRATASNFMTDLQQRQMQLVFEPVANQDDYEVQADIGRVEQILTNFISNAIKYGRVATAVTISFGHQDGQVVVGVRDQGIGIKPEDQQRLFTRFYRASNANSQGARGTGLGLSIVKTIVERHGGRVWLESRLNEGSTFSFSLPRA